MSLDPVVLSSALPPKAIAYLRRFVLQNLHRLQSLANPAWHDVMGSDTPGGHDRAPALSAEETIAAQALQTLMEQHQACLQAQGWSHPQLLGLEAEIFAQLGYRLDRDVGHREHHIALIDDQPETIQLLSAILRKQGHRTTILKSPHEAVDRIREIQPDLIILDTMMPFVDGYTVCQQIKADPDIVDIPIVFMSAVQNPLDKIKAFRLGGADYLVKPLQYEEVMTRIEHQLRLKDLQDYLTEKNQRFQQEVQEYHQSMQVLELVTRALNQQRDYVLVVKGDGQIIYSSQSTSVHLGYSPAELLKLKFYHLHAPLLPQQVSLIRQTLQQESILTLPRVHHVCKNGEWLAISLKLFSFQMDHCLYGCLVAQRTTAAPKRLRGAA